MRAPAVTAITRSDRRAPIRLFAAAERQERNGFSWTFVARR
jgi:hypothetical protein